MATSPNPNRSNGFGPGPTPHFNTGVTNAELLTAIQSEFLDWWLDPAREGTQTDWAKAHGLQPNKIGEWKRQPWFRKEWERRARELNLGPEKVQAVIAAVHAAALNGNVAAQKLYLQYAKELLPPALKRDEPRPLKEMSTEELKAAVAKLMETEGA
jgi:hypothetical protein